MIPLSLAHNNSRGAFSITVSSLHDSLWSKPRSIPEQPPNPFFHISLLVNYYLRVSMRRSLDFFDLELKASDSVSLCLEDEVKRYWEVLKVVKTP